ncbi:MAG: hypothetical protein QOI61_968 [Actinomycetota bacterium]
MWARGVGGALLCLMGVVWILQGLDIKKGDGMSGHPIWAVLGVLLIVLGGALLRAANASRARS